MAKTRVRVTIRHLVEYKENCVAPNNRSQLRKCRETVRLVQIREPRVLLEEGWPIFKSNAQRLGRFADITPERYLAGVERLVKNPGQLVVGAFVRDKLVAYCHNYAVGDVAYFDELHVAPGARPLHVSSLMYYEVAQAYRRSGKVTTVCCGPHLPERPGLSDYKTRMGCTLVYFPAYFQAPVAVHLYLRRFRPLAYYRLTGRGDSGLLAVGTRSGQGRHTSPGQ